MGRLTLNALLSFAQCKKDGARFGHAARPCRVRRHVHYRSRLGDLLDLDHAERAGGGAGLGCCLHDTLGLCPERPLAMGLWSRLELRLLGILGPEHDAHRRGLPNPHSRGREWRRVVIGYFVGFVLWPFATVAVQQATGSFALAFQPYRFSWLRWPWACGLSCPSTPARSSGPRLVSDYSKSGEWRSEVE
jgi:hypothetical protein